MKHKLLIGLIILSTFLTIPFVVVQAETVPQILRRDFRNAINGTSGDDGILSTTPGQLRRETNGSEREGFSGPTGSSGILGKIKDYIKKNFKFGARIEGTISAIGSGSLTVLGNDGKTYQVNVSSSTNLIRAFGGKSSLSEFSVSDKVMIFGKFTDTTNTTIDANTVRDLSIQKRWGVFFGKVTVLNSDNFVIQSVERGSQIVYFGTAKFVNRKEVTITYGDVKVGDTIRVKGVWDKTLNKITEVTGVKDFSIPTVTPTSTPSPTPTP